MRPIREDRPLEPLSGSVWICGTTVVITTMEGEGVITTVNADPTTCPLPRVTEVWDTVVNGGGVDMIVAKEVVMS
jgi:hypothetical protein